MGSIEQLYANITFVEAYETWQAVARRPMIFSAYERDFTGEESEKAIWDTHAMLRKLAMHIIQKSDVRDKLIQPTEFMTAMDEREFIDSGKMDLRFEVCADGYSVWLESPVIYPQHLRRMNDGFFDLILGLRQFGRWSFESLGEPDKRIKSNVYRLVVDAEADDLNDFGAIIVSWPFDVPADELLLLAPQAFAALHQVQYRLFRAEYQLRAGRKHR